MGYRRTPDVRVGCSWENDGVIETGAGNERAFGQAGKGWVHEGSKGVIFRMGCSPRVRRGAIAWRSKRVIGSTGVTIVDMADTNVFRKERAVGVCEVTDLLTHEACRDRLPKGVVLKYGLDGIPAIASDSSI